MISPRCGELRVPIYPLLPWSARLEVGTRILVGDSTHSRALDLSTAGLGVIKALLSLWVKRFGRVLGPLTAGSATLGTPFLGRGKPACTIRWTSSSPKGAPAQRPEQPLPLAPLQPRRFLDAKGRRSGSVPSGWRQPGFGAKARAGLVWRYAAAVEAIPRKEFLALILVTFCG